MFSSVGVVDLSQDDETAAQAIYDAFTKVGFCYVINHGVPAELIKRLEECSSKFFRLPEPVKAQIGKKHFYPDNSNTYRGFYPVQLESDSFKEAFEIGDDASTYEPKTKAEKVFYEKNPWPVSGDPDWDKTFRSTMNEGFKATTKVACRILRLVAISFGLDPSYFEPYFVDQITTYRFIHYPINDKTNKSELSCTEHFDSVVLTVLHQDTFGGLQVVNQANEWVDVPPLEDSFVINIGSTLEKWSGMKFRGTKHRVLGVDGERYSIPLFYEPNPNMPIKPLPATKNQDGMQTFEPFTYAEFMKPLFTRFGEYAGQLGLDDDE